MPVREPAGAASKGAPRGRSGMLRAANHLLLLALCAGLVAALHAPLAALPYYWDEAGYYIPAARDFFEHGDLVPRSTLKSPHPPLLSIYLAGAWTLFGDAPSVTRLAMAALAGAALYALLLLAARLGPGSLGARASRPQLAGSGKTAGETPALPGPAAAGLWAAALTLTCPLFFAQSTLAHLDVAATLGTLLVLYFYLSERLVPAIVAATLLCLVRETGAVLVVTLAALEWARWRRRPQEAGNPPPADALPGRALLLLLSLAPLAAWFVLLRWRSGLWLGDAEFAQYNFWGALHPARWALQFLKRAFQLGAANFQWAPALLILLAATRSFRSGCRRRAFAMPSEARRTLLIFIAAHVAFMSVFGGASLSRYLLPVFPLFFLLAADAAFTLRFPGRAAVLTLVPLAFVAGWFWNPPYPYSYEDNLSYADFVRLHRDTAPLLEQLPPGTRILTAWPASDELSRPALGYVRRPLAVVSLADFSEPELERIAPGDFDVLFLYSRQSHPEWLARHPRLAALQQRYFGIRQQAPAVWIGARFGLELRTRAEMRDQWVEIWTRPGMQLQPTVIRAVHRSVTLRRGRRAADPDPTS